MSTRHKRLIATIIMIVAIMIVSVLIGEIFFNSWLAKNTLSTASANTLPSIIDDPWGQKGVLNYLFWTADAKL